MRDIRFDIQKAILMIFVMIAHTIGHFNFIHILTIPAFVIIGAYFTKIKKTDNFLTVLKKRFYIIMSYYFIFSFISLIFYLSRNEITNVLPLLNCIFNGTVLGDLANDNNFNINLPLWFLPYFFSIMSLQDIGLIFSDKISKRFFENKKNIVFNIIFLIYVLIITSLSYFYVIVLKKKSLIYHIDLAMLTLPLTFFGRIILPNIISLFDKIKNNIKKLLIEKIVVLFSATIIFCIFYYCSIKIDYIDMYPRLFGNSFFLFLFFAMFSYISLFLISDFLLNIKYISDLLSYFGKISLYLMAYHMPSHLVFLNINVLFPRQIIWFLTEYNTVVFNIFLIIYMFLFSAFMSEIHKGIKYIINK